MKTIVIGKRGIGVTTFIKNNLLKKNDKVLIFDLNDEYKEFNTPRAIFSGYRVFPLRGITINQINEKVMGMMFLAKEDETIVLDSFKSYISPKIDKNRKINFSWLDNILKDKKTILTLNSVADISIENIGINMDDVQKIYLFDTMDNEKLIKRFISKYQNIIERVPKFVRIVS